jgi:putative ABC transport system permease protein
MKALSALWFSVRSLVIRRRADTELDEELAYHIEREAAMYEHQGMSRADARREAHRQFGGVARYRDECRDVRRTTWLDDARADIGFALRLIRLYPGFSANVILISALGIAACATTFSIVSGILLSPLPFSAPDRIGWIELRSAEGSASVALPIDAYLRVAAGSPVIEAIAAFRPSGAAVEWNGEPERIRTELVTPSFFRVFGITPIVGRVFTTDETAQQTPVALLGYETWRTRFNEDPAVVGRRLSLDDVSYTIVGVMPARFRAHFSSEPDLWLPLGVTRTDARADGTVNAVARLAPGVTRPKAAAWLATVTHAKIESNTQADSVAASPTLQPITELVYGYVRRPLLVLLGAVLLVLVLVCANVATMFLARSAARDRELSVRRALGASNGRQLRQLVAESATLSAIGGLLGTVASYWVVGGIRGLGFRVLPRMDAVTLDWRVLMFAVVGTILTGIIGGLTPAFSAWRDTTARIGASSGARVTGQRTSSTLVVVQITLSVVLLVGAGLLVKGFLRVLPTEPGFAVENRATLSIALRGLPWFPDTGRFAARRFIHDVDERMRRVSGVRDVAATSFLPFFGSVSIANIGVVGRPVPVKPLTAFQNLITSNFFDVMRIPLRRGRAFSNADGEGGDRVAIVNETAAARWWPGENPIGRQVNVEDRERFVATIVGVVGDGRLFGTDTKIRPQIYFPVAQSHPRNVAFVAATSSDPRSLSHDLKRAIWSVAPRMPIGSATDLATLASESLRRARFFSWAMGVFAATAVALSALAVYGLLAFAVVQRRREIGIRLALGAPRRRIGALVLKRAVALGASGVIVGIALARGLSRYMESLLIEVTATDATVFGSTAVAVLAVAIIAACVPAYQALHVDPVRSLRES